MALALGTAALMLMTLLSVLALPHLKRLIELARLRLSKRTHHKRLALVDGYDPGRELRAEQRARALLRSCVNEEEWAMYSELGFLGVGGTVGPHPYAYLIYPHRPILAYDPHSKLILGEYCVEFPDRTRPYGSARLPDSDDVLAKWMALATDERSLIERSNMHLPGRQIDIAQARRDLARLACWERERAALGTVGAPVERVAPRARASLHAGSVPAL